MRFSSCFLSSAIAIWKRKTLIPPEVEPEQAPAINRKAKMVEGSAPHAVKSSRP
ncbi:Uncharacterised protein [Vibrio cholerae]|nr:Uncharacterised protein [Vibrio cholerae]